MTTPGTQRGADGPTDPSLAAKTGATTPRGNMPKTPNPSLAKDSPASVVDLTKQWEGGSTPRATPGGARVHLPLPEPEEGLVF